MKLKELMTFLGKAMEEFGGNAEVVVEYEDRTDPYAPVERIVPVLRASAASELRSDNDSALPDRRITLHAVYDR